MWEILKKFVAVETPWVRLIGEQVKDESSRILEYWRVEKDDSVIVLPVYKGDIVLPPRFYRHGIQEYTLDFPGGRRRSGENSREVALKILERELSIPPSCVESLKELNRTGWIVNSSFSNQRLFGFVAAISDTFKFPPNSTAKLVPCVKLALENLLSEMSCAQCRVVLLEWLYQRNELSEAD